jgi:hypothetical protein
VSDIWDTGAFILFIVIPLLFAMVVAVIWYLDRRK